MNECIPQQSYRIIGRYIDINQKYLNQNCYDQLIQTSLNRKATNFLLFILVFDADLWTYIYDFLSGIAYVGLLAFNSFCN